VAAARIACRKIVIITAAWPEDGARHSNMIYRLRDLEWFRQSRVRGPWCSGFDLSVFLGERSSLGSWTMSTRYLSTIWRQWR
jgi:hypothetical protein